jgi:uncharacterized heparinase superfamily protein
MAPRSEWLVWTARKLASQTPATLLRRLRYAAQRRFVDRVFPGPVARRRASIALPAGALWRHLQTRPAPVWHWPASEILDRAGAVPEARRARTIQTAEDLLQRRFSFSGREPMTLPPGDWAPHGVSCNWLSCLNRHQWFTTLGFAYRYTGDPRFARCFVTESTDWMDRHIGRLGRLGWDGPFEVGSRVNAWLWAHFLFLGAPDWPAAHYERFVRGLGLLAEYLYESLEYHSPGNHVILEAKALALCGEVLPVFRGAAAWRRKAWRTLARELRLQIGPDGVHAERSTMYHRIIAGELAELWAFCRRNDRPQAAALEDVVRRMAEFQRWIDQDTGMLPLFGDAYAQDNYYRFSAPAVVAARDGNDGRALIGEATDHGFWLLGTRGRADTPPPPPPPAGGPAGRAFAPGGYFVARTGWSPTADVLVWDCGPTGYHRNRKHAHLDALSLTLSVAGVPLLIDPGTGTQERRELLRRTRAHSTVSVDGMEQGVPAQRDEIWSPPNTALRLWATSPECTVMAGRHDGYRRLAAPVWHERTIVVLPGLYWLVVDAFDGVGDHRVEQRFHVVPGAYVGYAKSGDGVDIAKDGATLALRWVQSGAPPVLRLDLGVSEMHFGHPERSWLVTAERRGCPPFALAVVAAPDPAVRIASDRTAGGVQLTISGPGFEHRVRLNQAAPPPGDEAAVTIERRPVTGAPDRLIVTGTGLTATVRRAALEAAEPVGAL